MNSRFFKLGGWVAGHPYHVLAAWVVLIALGAWGSHELDHLTVGGAGGMEGSPSAHVAESLRADFTNPFIDPLAVAVSAPALEIDAAPYREWLAHCAAALRASAAVRKVATYEDTHDAHMRSKDGHVTLLLVGMAATDVEGQQRAVAAVRERLEPLRAELAALDPGAAVAVTGGAAGDYDVNALSAVGGDHAEKHALPLTLAILAVAFGTLIAACLPFLMGLATTTVALGCAFILAELVPVSNLLSNVVTMVGLAIGIDYSLLMVTHYREHTRLETIAQTVAGTVAQAGQTIAWSGVTVMVGFLGLLFSPLLETRCAGIGGALVVCISVLAALTLLPAVLVITGPYLDCWHVIPQRWRNVDTTSLWKRLGGRHRAQPPEDPGAVGRGGGGGRPPPSCTPTWA